MGAPVAAFMAESAGPNTEPVTRYTTPLVIAGAGPSWLSVEPEGPLDGLAVGREGVEVAIAAFVEAFVDEPVGDGRLHRPDGSRIRVLGPQLLEPETDVGEREDSNVS